MIAHILPASVLTLRLLTAGCSAPAGAAGRPAPRRPPQPRRDGGRHDRCAWRPGASTPSCPPPRSIEKVAGGFKFTEGPLWRPDGTLWFSDVRRQRGPLGHAGRHGEGAHRERGRRVDRAARNRTSGPTAWRPTQDGIGADGPALNRQIVRVGAGPADDPVVVDTFEGKRFNSPNDLVFGSDGSLYFTDPPFGLAKQDDDPAKELAFNGVYRFADGQLTALVRDLNRPNGIAFSPDEKTLYVSTTPTRRRRW